MDLQEVGYGGVDWTQLTENRATWQAIVTAIMNFRLHKIWGIS
jgi:hypothetical protein